MKKTILLALLCSAFLASCTMMDTGPDDPAAPHVVTGSRIPHK